MIHECESCEIHGFPCLNCAEEVFRGSQGPGMYKGVLCIIEEIPQEIIAKMLEVHESRGDKRNIEYYADQATLDDVHGPRPLVF